MDAVKPERFRRRAIRHLLIELFEMLVVRAGAEASGDLLADDKDSQEPEREADAPDRRDFLGQQIDQRRAEKDQKDDRNADRQIDLIAVALNR